MMNKHLDAWLRPACAIFCGTGILLLTACGGGNGAPNNQFAPPPPVIPPLQILPATSTVYQGTPAVLTISGGVPPYRAFSSDQSALPVGQAVSGNSIVLAATNVPGAVSVAVSVQDATGTVSPSALVVVNPAPLFQGGVTVTANPNPECQDTSNAICSGGTGTAQIKVLGNSQVGIPGHALRFDVIQGNFQIVSTNPAQPLVQTLTVVSDNQGNATVVLAVAPNTPTQSALIRVTDLTNGQQITGSFRILQVTASGQVLSVLPLGTTTITGPDTQHCSSGVVVNYYIFGGTPPYTVVTNFPQAIALGGMPVTKSGNSFTATTTGVCFVNGTFIVTDATGLTAGNAPTMTNNLGTGAPIPPLTPLIVTPGAIAKNNCVPANTFQFIGTGGTTPYSAVVTSSTSSTSALLAPQTGIAQGTAVVVSGLTSPSSTTITLFDSSSPRQSGVVQVDCSGQPNTPAPAALVISPPNYNFSQPPPQGAGTCVNQIGNFAVTGGTPPYSVFFATPRPGATITPSTVASSGQGFAVTGLTDGVLTTNITVQDSGTPQLQQIATITCPVVPKAGPMVVTPATYTYIGEQACSTIASSFSITQGTPPFTVFFSTPGTQGAISATTVFSNVPPGNQFTVSGLAAAPIPRTTQLTVQDSSSPSQFQTVNIDCRP